MIGYKFKDYLHLREGKENFDQPHVITADPPMKVPAGLERLAEAFKKSKEVPIGKEVDSKAGGEKNVTMKGRKLFIVGGAVRDYLLGHTPKNYDLCTDAHPEEMVQIMKHVRPPIQVLKVDKKNGVVEIDVDGEKYKIETMRKESKGGKKVSMEPTEGGESGDEEQGITFTANPAEDCERRDLTINCLYYEIATKKISDYTGGLRHIQDGTIKFVGRPEDRLSEDGMRKYRFMHMLNKVPGAKADKDSKAAVMKMSADTDDEDPGEVRDAFWKGMEDHHTSADKYIKSYKDMGLLDKVFPKLDLSTDFPSCKTCKSRPIVLAWLLKNNQPPKLIQQLRALKYVDREIKDAVYLVNLLRYSPEYAQDFKKELMKTSLTRRQIMDWCKINDLDSDTIEQMLSGKAQSED